jgi:hypothetical protein
MLNAFPAWQPIKEELYERYEPTFFQLPEPVGAMVSAFEPSGQRSSPVALGRTPAGLPASALECKCFAFTQTHLSCR